VECAKSARMVSLSNHTHVWIHLDMYFSHNRDEIYDLYVCHCGEEKQAYA
jgi:hypothetical protein